MTTQPPGDRPSGPVPGQDPPSRPLDPRITSWGRRTGPLNRGTTPADPPDLSRYADTPRYDMATVIELVGVRAVTLWAWEQNLGLALGETTNGVRYSERDLIALVWLRDQIIQGVDPMIAAQQLRVALAAARGGPAPSMPLQQRPPSQPIGTIPPRQESRTPSQGLPQRGLTHPTGEPMRRPPTGGAIAGTPWMPASAPRDLRMMVHPLLQALSQFDAAIAGHIMDDALVSRSIELVCQSLWLPAIARINELWVRPSGVLPEGLFAINVLKARLFRHFDMSGEHRGAPLTCIASGPGDQHELEALMTALLWRRAGLRVLYLGGEASVPILVEVARRAQPRIVALTMASAARARLIRQLSRDLEHLPARPQLCVIGAAPARSPDLARRLGALCLGANPLEATPRARQLLRLPDVGGSNG
jgi:hypothetical protein